MLRGRRAQKRGGELTLPRFPTPTGKDQRIAVPQFQIRFVQEDSRSHGHWPAAAPQVTFR